MPSNINPFNVNGNYPVAGQDNDSQGFRDNFTNIRTNLNFAKSEIEDLQAKALLKAPLTGGGSVTNTLNGAILSGAQLVDTSEKTVALVASAGTATLNFSLGHLQSLTLDTESVTLDISEMPASGQLGKVRLLVDVVDEAYTLTFPNSVSNATGLSEVRGVTTNTLTFPGPDIYIFELSSYNGGVDIWITEITKKLLKVPARGLTASGTFAPTFSLANAYTTQLGRYTQNGDVVSFTAFINCTITGTGNVTATLTGLPLSDATTNLNTAVVVSNVSGFNLTAGGAVTAYIAPNTNIVTFQRTVDTGATSATLTNTSLTGPVTFTVSGTYFV